MPLAQEYTEDGVPVQILSGKCPSEAFIFSPSCSDAVAFMGISLVFHYVERFPEALCYELFLPVLHVTCGLDLFVCPRAAREQVTALPLYRMQAKPTPQYCLCSGIPEVRLDRDRPLMV